MKRESAEKRPELITLLGTIVGNQPLTPEVQRKSLEVFATLLRQSNPTLPSTSPAAMASSGAAVDFTSAALSLGPASASTIAASRRLIYVHGICRHTSGFSDSWWEALSPFVPAAFGAGTLGQTRREVIWSDLVNHASAQLATAAFAAAAGAVPGAQMEAPLQERNEAAAEIRETLQDRADQHMMSAMALDGSLAAGSLGASESLGFISIPGLSCIDDFAIYLTSDSVRKTIIDRFIDVVRPELLANRELDIIAHSWGTVVAYEGLRQLEAEGVNPPLVRNFFTAGAALSIGAVKKRLRSDNQDGRKPASVRNWANLDARGDLVGGPLKGRHYAVDLDFLGLDAPGCSIGFLSNPSCAHSSYFSAANVTVNQDIFAQLINQP